jgi:signal transduction histidine kinase
MTYSQVSTDLRRGLVAVILTIGVFSLDYLTPLGYAEPILYLIPLALIGQSYWRRGVYWYAGCGTLLAVTGYFVGPDGGMLAPAFFNRSVSILVLWGAAFVLSSEKRTEWALAQQADTNQAILDAVMAHITLIDRNGQAMQFQSGSKASASSNHASGFTEALQSTRWQEVRDRSASCDPTDPDDYLRGVWEVVQGRRMVYSTEYGRMTPSGFRWFLLYASRLERGGAVVAHIDMTERREAQEALQEREREIQLLLDARESLAQDLHDEVIQRLYALGLKLSTWRRRMGERGSPIASQFGEAIFDIDQVIHQVRGYIDGTTGANLDGHDLAHHVQQLIGSMVKDTAVLSDVAIDSTTASYLTAAQVTHVLAMIREAVSNALQHAGAARVLVTLKPQADQAILLVQDDGGGFDPDVVPQGRGHGLANMRARAIRIGGQALIQSTREQGTTVRVQFPLEVRCDVH